MIPANPGAERIARSLVTIGRGSKWDSIYIAGRLVKRRRRWSKGVRPETMRDRMVAEIAAALAHHDKGYADLVDVYERHINPTFRTLHARLAAALKYARRLAKERRQGGLR